jgi:hypothetical protein
MRIKAKRAGGLVVETCGSTMALVGAEMPSVRLQLVHFQANPNRFN